MTDSSFQLQPIDTATAAALRARGGTVYVADGKPGYPCRQCLVDAEIGEELILVSHTPFELDSEYRSASPIFLHKDECVTPIDLTNLPEQLTSRQLSVRSFDADELMIDAVVVQGAELGSTLDRLFDNGDANRVHVHNATRGCWAVSVARYIA